MEINAAVLRKRIHDEAVDDYSVTWAAAGGH